MGVAQNALMGALGTAAAGAAAVGKVSADIEKAAAAKEQAEIAKMDKAESLQKDFLQNKEAISHMGSQMEGLEKAANAGNSRAAHKLGYTDRQAAQVALQEMQEKQLALREMNERRALQYEQITGQTIIGGDK